MTTALFLGPSLDPRIARSCTSAQVLPPIRRGDLTRVVRAGVLRVGIIDGEFGQSLAVSVTEIREALRERVEVWGAASMGALRAAECAALGMRGIGYVYEKYATGEIEADEEVALLFDADSNVALTVPLVNVRWALQRAVESALFGPEEASQLLEVARSIGYEARTYTMVAAAAPLSLRDKAVALLRLVSADSHNCDRKRLDALLLLERMEAVGNRAASDHGAQSRCGTGISS